jgi:Fic family protein
MTWNWQLPDWPAFHVDLECLIQLDKKFLLVAGSCFAFWKKMDEDNQQKFAIAILSSEGEQSARIEGEILNRDSLQSSIKKQFGLQLSIKTVSPREAGMAELLFDVYTTYAQPLTHEMLWEWHRKLFQGATSELEIGKYRSHSEPMQIVSHRLDAPKVFFEAPPSSQVFFEMQRFIEWVNGSSQSSILGKAALAHLYFENIHPFEDGNGRIGRAIVEKILSQSLGRPILIAVSKVLEKRKKEYYKALEACNRTLEATGWTEFFANVILEAQEESLNLLNFILEKAKLFTRLHGLLNPRQEKVLLRMFQEGPEGFQGGLSAEKYVAITGISRATATRDLTELVEMGALVKTGELRHTRYWLKLDHFQ